MNKETLKDLVKSYFQLEEKQTSEDTNIEATAQKFDEATLVDGTKVSNHSEDAFAVGQELFVELEDGTSVLAPEGEHVTESGITVVVDAEGKIAGIHSPDQAAEGDLAETEEDMKEEMSSEEAEVTIEAKVEMAEEDEEVAMMDPKEEIIDVIMAEVAPMITEMRTELDNCMAKLEEQEEKMKEYMAKPASEPTSESRFSKVSKKDIKAPAAVHNVKRYEAALNRLTNK